MGPFLLRRCRGRCSEVNEKVWAPVFICMATKVVHIEIADGCSVAEFLDTFARFSAHRCYPSHIYSDCGTHFQGAESFFKQLNESSTMSGFLASHGLRWHLNPPAAPHFGGCGKPPSRLWSGIFFVPFPVALFWGLSCRCYWFRSRDVWTLGCWCRCCRISVIPRPWCPLIS